MLSVPPTPLKRAYLEQFRVEDGKVANEYGLENPQLCPVSYGAASGNE